jgi:hypothetical protein
MENEIIEQIENEPQNEQLKEPEQTKEFNSKKRDYVKNYNKKYYEQNREKQLQNMKTTCRCTLCNCVIRFYKKQQHQRSKKHLQLLEIAPNKDDEMFKII